MASADDLPHDMHDDRWFELISAAADGELAPEDQDRLDRHLGTCPECRVLAQQVDAQRRRVRMAPVRGGGPALALVLDARDRDRSQRQVRRVLIRRTLASAAALLVAVAGLWALEPPRATEPTTELAAAPAAVHIDARSRSFDRAEVEVAPGSVVEWRNTGETRHRLVRMLGGAVIEEDLPPGRSESVTFAEPGTYEYYCTIHDAMAGTVTVAS